MLAPSGSQLSVYFTVTFFCAYTVFGTKPAPAASEPAATKARRDSVPLDLLGTLRMRSPRSANSVNCNATCMPMAHDLLPSLVEGTHGHIDHQAQEAPAGRRGGV